MPFVALTPTTPTDPNDKRAKAKAAQDEALLREVDDAYRQGQYSEFAEKYGKPLLALLILGLAAFGGYLFWESRQEAAMEQDSEQIVAALDQLQAGNFDTASTTLKSVADSDFAGTAAVAKMMQAGIAADRGRPEEAAKIFAAVAADGDAPEQLRNLASIRELALTFDQVEPDRVIARLKPLAVPGNPWFGSAGELVAMAYLEQGNDQQAGTLFAELAKAEDVPSSLRSRSRQMAGLLGVDAIEDVDALLEQQNAGGEVAGQSAAPAAAPQ